MRKGHQAELFHWVMGSPLKRSFQCSVFSVRLKTGAFTAGGSKRLTAGGGRTGGPADGDPPAFAHMRIPTITGTEYSNHSSYHRRPVGLAACGKSRAGHARVFWPRASLLLVRIWLQYASSPESRSRPKSTLHCFRGLTARDFCHRLLGRSDIENNTLLLYLLARNIPWGLENEVFRFQT